MSNVYTPTITLYALGAYNSGKLVPKTFKLWEYSDYGEYLDAVQAWLEPLGEEEWIVCDYEEIPAQYVSEYSLDPEFFEFMGKADELGYDLCCAAVSLYIPVERIDDAYLGEYDSMEDYAYEYLSEVYELDKLPAIITCHIDWRGVARDLSVDVSFENGYVFSRNW